MSTQQNGAAKLGWDRTTTGRFAKGNKGGPGTQPGVPHTNNKLAKRAIAEEVTLEEHHRIARTVADKALAGDLNAVKLLWDRLFGRPAQGLYPADGPSGDPAHTPEELVRLLLLADLADRVPPGLEHLIEPIRASLGS